MISKEALEEFKRIWKKQFNEDISDEKALKSGTKLLILMNAIYCPIKKEWLKGSENKYKQNGKSQQQ